MLNRVAWSPLSDPDTLALVTIVCAANHPMDRDLYLSYLGDRIQRMIDACEDPDNAIGALQDEFLSTGLLLQGVHCPTDDAGNRLVTSNPGVWEKLSYLGVFAAVSRCGRAAGVDDLAARRALRDDIACPEDALLAWAAGLGAVMDRFDPEPDPDEPGDEASAADDPAGVDAAPARVYVVPLEHTLRARMTPLLAQGFRLTKVELPPRD